MINFASHFGVVVYTDFDNATSTAFWVLGFTTKYLTFELPEFAGVDDPVWGLVQGVVGTLPLGLLLVEELPDRTSPGARGPSVKTGINSQFRLLHVQ